jgi:hypothetical protein
MAVSLSDVQKAAATGTDMQYTAAYGAHFGNTTNAAADKSDMAKAYNASRGNNNSNSSSSSMGSILDPYNVIKAGQGDSRISQMSEQLKTGLETEADLTDTVKLNEAILKQLKLESDLHTQINEGMGMTGKLSEAFRDSIIDTLPKAAMLGYDIQNISDAVTNLSEKTGKLNIIASNTLEQGFETARAFGMTLPQLTEAMGEFEKVGYGAADTLDKINNAGMKSASLGLNARKTTQDLKTNIEKLNEYGFKNGVDGLNRMVQKAAEFRMNMAETFKVAEKVMNPESAIELTANMQMLGGAIGYLNDPLKLMYMATNNVEGLQDALQGAASTLATYNTEQQRFEITGANLRRAQEMAKTLGVDYKEFTKGAIAAQERILANDTLLSKGFNIDDKEMEFLTNLSSMKDGEMQIVIPKSLQESLGKELGANELKLSELSDTQVALLKQYQDQLETKTPAEMAQDMFSETAKIRNATEATAKALVTYGKRQIFGREGRMQTEGSLPIVLPAIKALGELRQGQYEFSKDNNYIKGIIDQPLSILKSGTTFLNLALTNMVTTITDATQALKNSTKGTPTDEQKRIEEENNRRKEGQKAGNASVNHYHTFKISKTNNLENFSIDQTSKGFTGNQTIPQYNSEYNV